MWEQRCWQQRSVTVENLTQVPGRMYYALCVTASSMRQSPLSITLRLCRIKALQHYSYWWLQGGSCVGVCACQSLFGQKVHLTAANASACRRTDH